MNAPNFNKESFNQIVDIIIRLGFLFLIVAWCFSILTPFVGVLTWGIILALALHPLHSSLTRRFKGKIKLASAIVVIGGILAVIIPSWLFLDSVIGGLKGLGTQFQEGTLKIPPPNPDVADWPLVGDKVFDLWTNAASNMESFLIEHRDQFLSFGEVLLSGITSLGASVITIILAIVIAGALLSSKDAQQLGRRFFHRLVGDGGDKVIELTTKTVSSVVRGVIGVALIQTILIGLGFLGIGLPYAGVWTLIVLILAVLQLPPTLVVIPVVIWLFSTTGTLPATLWTIYLIAAAISDTPLKAIMLGKGALVPMLVIFLGVIGGFIFSGFLGLFTGAIVVSLGYTLFIAWLRSGEESDENAPLIEEAEA